MTPEQLDYLRGCAGAARFAYNWGLERWQKEYQAVKDGVSSIKPNGGALRKTFNAEKKIALPGNYAMLPPEEKRQYFSWMSKYSKCVPQQALRNLDKAFTAFFEKKRDYPVFKSRARHSSFYIENSQVGFTTKTYLYKGKEVTRPALKLPKMNAVFELTEEPRFKHHTLMSATFSCVADEWFVSLQYNVKINDPKPTKKRLKTEVGIDAGITTFATTVDHQGVVKKEDGPRPMKMLVDRLRRLDRHMARQVMGSKNRDKTKRRRARLMAKIANIRRDFQHKLSTKLATQYHRIKVETLNIKSMLKNHKLALHISDRAWYQFQTMLDYKTKARGGELVKVDRYFPSTRWMPCCNIKLKSVTLNDRTLRCTSCGTEVDRDENAARNILNWDAWITYS